MAMAMALRMALLAALLAKAESPPFHCNDGEYAYNGQRCCKMCRAGTYVEEPCTTPHTLGHCSPCTNGEDFTEHENGLNRCFPCEKCKPGYVMVKACTATSNTKCQCPEGHYCPPGCEECLKCKKGCPKGEVQVRSCSTTTDIECAPPSTGTTDSTHLLGTIITWVFSVFGFGIMIMIAVLLFKFRKRNSRSTLGRVKESKSLISISSDALTTNPEMPAAEMPGLRNKRSQNEESSNLMVGSTNEGSEPETVPTAPFLQQSENPVSPNIPKKPMVKLIEDYSKDELTRIYYQTRDMIPILDWPELMRKCGLTNNDIEIIKADYPNNRKEAHHQMLLTLQNQLGIGGALYKLLDGLWELKLMTIYENVTNELVSHKIILETID